MFLAPQNCWQSWHSANYFIKEDLKFDCKEWQVQRELHAGITIKKILNEICQNILYNIQSSVS